MSDIMATNIFLHLLKVAMVCIFHHITQKLDYDMRICTCILKEISFGQDMHTMTYLDWIKKVMITKNKHG